MQYQGNPGEPDQNIAKWLLKGLEELNGFDIIHTDLKPENVAIVLEPEDYPENRNISLYMDKEVRLKLFCLEVTILTVIFHKIIKFEPLYKILFNSADKKNEVVWFLKYCTEHRSLLEFLQPPYREKLYKESKRGSNLSRHHDEGV